GDRSLPPHVKQGFIVANEKADACENESPCELDRGSRFVAGRRDGNSKLFRSRVVDRSISWPGRRDQLEMRKALKHLSPQRCPFAHYTNDIEGIKPFDESLRIGNVIAEDCDLSPCGKSRPIRHFQSHILIIVKDGDPDRASFGIHLS